MSSPLAAGLAPYVPPSLPPDAHPGAAITAPEADAMFRACLTLFARWGLTDREAAFLLDTTPRTYARWKAQKSGSFTRDQACRLSNLIGIHKALRLIFTDTDRVYAWPRRPNAAFAGRTALEVMLGGNLTDLMRVRRYLDAERGF